MRTVIVKGMRCAHRKATVKEAASDVLNYEENPPVDVQNLKNTIENSGFGVEL